LAAVRNGEMGIELGISGFNTPQRKNTEKTKLEYQQLCHIGEFKSEQLHLYVIP
jgi:hypothetical protein